MSRTNQMIEEMNYRNDPRVQALDHDDGLEFDEDTMKLTWATENDDGEEVVVRFDAVYEVCDLCHGKGTHVNPSIDAGGIGEDDEFWEDDQDWNDEDDDGQFVSRYARGDYDVPCNLCGGKRVVPVIAESEHGSPMYKLWCEERESDAEFRREQESERRHGA